MVIELDKRLLIFNSKRIWFSDAIHDVEGCSNVFFRECKFKKDVPGFQRITVPVMTIDLTKNLDEIWSNMNRNTRRNIKKAEENQITIKINEKIDEFYEVYLDHIKNKKHVKWFDLEKKETIKQGNIFTAEYKGDVISGLVTLENHDNILCWIASNKRFTPELKTIVGNASHLIHWEAIKYAKAKGIKEYSFSGTPLDKTSELYSLTIYKGGFGAEMKQYYTYYKDYNILFRVIRGTYRRFKKDILMGEHEEQ